MASYDTITVEQGEDRVIPIRSGETFANKLIDVTAPGASVQLDASGQRWTIRNVGIKGENGRQGMYHAAIKAKAQGGRCTVKEVYLGDGSPGPSRVTGLWVHNHSTGEILLKHIYAAGYADNALYGSDPGYSELGGQGATVMMEDSYVESTNVAAFRVGSEGSYVKNCVADQTGDIPANNAGHVTARAVYAKHNTTKRVINCDFRCNQGPIVATKDGGTVELENCRWEHTGGQALVNYDYGEINGTNQGPPDLSVPAGVPRSAEAAASGEIGAATMAAVGNLPENVQKYALVGGALLAGYYARQRGK